MVHSHGQTRRLTHLDFGRVWELTTDPSTRDRIREHGKPLGGNAFTADAPLLAMFTTDQCAPCERLLPVVQELARHWHDRMTTVRVHCPDHPELAAALNIQSAPTPGSLVIEDLKAELSAYLGLVAR